MVNPITEIMEQGGMKTATSRKLEMSPEDDKLVTDLGNLLQLVERALEWTQDMVAAPPGAIDSGTMPFIGPLFDEISGWIDSIAETDIRNELRANRQGLSTQNFDAAANALVLIQETLYHHISGIESTYY